MTGESNKEDSGWTWPTSTRKSKYRMCSSSSWRCQWTLLELSWYFKSTIYSHAIPKIKSKESFIPKIDSGERRREAAAHQRDARTCCILKAMQCVSSSHIRSNAVWKSPCHICLGVKLWPWPINVGNHKPPTTNMNVSARGRTTDPFLYVSLKCLHILFDTFLKNILK